MKRFLFSLLGIPEFGKREPSNLRKAVKSVGTKNTPALWRNLSSEWAMQDACAASGADVTDSP
jgi:hypothetical protein